jgi:hypothetical protein
MKKNSIQHHKLVAASSTNTSLQIKKSNHSIILSHPIKDYKEYTGQLELLIESQSSTIKNIQKNNEDLKEQCIALENELFISQSTLKESVQVVEMLQSKVRIYQ